MLIERSALIGFFNCARTTAKVSLPSQLHTPIRPERAGRVDCACVRGSGLRDERRKMKVGRVVLGLGLLASVQGRRDGDGGDAGGDGDGHWREGFAQEERGVRGGESVLRDGRQELERKWGADVGFFFSLVGCFVLRCGLR